MAFRLKMIFHHHSSSPDTYAERVCVKRQKLSDLECLTYWLCRKDKPTDLSEMKWKHVDRAECAVSAEGNLKDRRKSQHHKTAAQWNSKFLSMRLRSGQMKCLNHRPSMKELKERRAHSVRKNAIEKFNKTSNDETNSFFFFLSEYDKSKIAGKRQIAKKCFAHKHSIGIIGSIMVCGETTHTHHIII